MDWFLPNSIMEDQRATPVGPLIKLQREIYPREEPVFSYMGLSSSTRLALALQEPRQ